MSWFQTANGHSAIIAKRLRLLQRRDIKSNLPAPGRIDESKREPNTQTSAYKVIKLSFETLREITRATYIVEPIHGSSFHGVSIDSRTVSPGELFVAIKGERVDGHEYVQNALEQSAAGALVSEALPEFAQSSSAILLVRDSHHALIELAKHYRNQVPATYLGVTGSSGKTTVKEMIAHLLNSGGARVFQSTGNFNNLYGMPLSILRMPGDTEYGVYELGVSTIGEMSKLAPILSPDIAVITNISATHLKTMGNVECVRNEKLQLFKSLNPDGIAIVNADDSALLNEARRLFPNVLSFSAQDDSKADFVARNVTTDLSTGYCSFEFEGARVNLHVFGEHQVANAICALAVCSAAAAKVYPATLESYQPQTGSLRGEIETRGGISVIADCYNASPDAMISGLRSFFKMKLSDSSGRKIAVVGDMLELGEKSESERLRVGAEVAKLQKTLSDSGEIGTHILITVGLAKQIAEPFSNTNVNVINCNDNIEAGEELARKSSAGDMIYFKGSRGVALEKAIEVFWEKLSERESE
ncbi:MAG: UDP-N-acetylmuramoyl-tripeptide--D-alanyl-D-alanine ligase [candidate division Zixibacteria bacterium]|nr:UDP-N-acetylmuramoyl-tripeptide--D-alanyl-D-alanine ligase [candidate division Zixibacteria bacterium]